MPYCFGAALYVERGTSVGVVRLTSGETNILGTFWSGAGRSRNKIHLIIYIGGKCRAFWAGRVCGGAIRRATRCGYFLRRR